jgi:hypothetical protein
MYDLRPIFYEPRRYSDDGYRAGNGTFAAAMRRYQSLCLRSRIAGLFAHLTGRSDTLLDLNATKAASRLVSSHDVGVRAVRLDQIVGSEGRAGDFDSEFRPRCDASRERWAGIYAARLAGVSMPAIRLVQVGNVYFVRDGHHRVSVARIMREEFMDADVTVWELAPQAGPDAAALSAPTRLIYAD